MGGVDVAGYDYWLLLPLLLYVGEEVGVEIELVGEALYAVATVGEVDIVKVKMWQLYADDATFGIEVGIAKLGGDAEMRDAGIDADAAVAGAVAEVEVAGKAIGMYERC